MGYILIIEDDMCTQTSLSRVLERHGHQTHCVYDGMEGIEMIKEKSFDLAIVDMHLADMTGPEVIKNITDHDKNMPIVGISGGNPQRSKSMDLLESISKMHRVETIRKPINLDEFLNVVSKSIEKRYRA